jgi:Tfp pilus assembly protein PilO
VAERVPRRLQELLDRWKPVSAALAAVVVANVLLHVFVIRQSVQVSGGREAILSTEQQRVAKVRAELRELERTASKLACAESDAAQVFDVMLSSKLERMTAIQRELRKLASDKGLDPNRISYEVSPLKETGLVRFGISFPLEGQYETLQAFIESVEASKNVLIVENISMSESQGTTLKLQIRLVTYFQSTDIEALRKAFPGIKA